MLRDVVNQTLTEIVCSRYLPEKDHYAICNNGIGVQKCERERRHLAGFRLQKYTLNLL